MPMEHIRKRLLGDANLYPEFGGSGSKPISVGSTSTTSSVNSEQPPAKSVPRTKQVAKKSTTVIISSDEEEDELDQTDTDSDVVEITGTKSDAVKKGGPSQPTPPLHPRAPNMAQPTPFQTNRPPVPIQLPTDGYRPPAFMQRPVLPTAPTLGTEDEEVIKLPDAIYDNMVMSQAETEKALRDLMHGTMNQELEVDMSQEIVEGFKDGIKLLPHQILGRAWMKDREDVSKKRSGGILADDMGLGKTIQTLTRIVEGRPNKSDKQEGFSGCSLVICPLALVEQWASEIGKMTNLRAVKHHGADRATNAEALKKFHVVITTYDTVKSEYAVFNPASTKAKNESKPTSSKKAAAKDSDDDSEVEDFGRNAKKKGKAAAKKCALFGLKWWRVILDEAHNIKNVKTKGAIACCELDAKFRWCLTGTPMQNNVTELYSLIKFLRVKPLNNWDTFNMQIAKPVNNGRGAAGAMRRLQVVLKAVMLRRRKDQLLNGEVLIKLPKRTVDIVPCEFDPAEREFYDALESKMEGVIEKIMAKSGGNSYISVLTLLLRLRQACNHPILVSSDYKGDTDALEPKPIEKGKDDQDPDAADLIAAFDRMGVTKKCRMCTVDLTPEIIGEGRWNTHCQDCVPLAIKAKKAESERPTSAKVRMVLKLLKEIGERPDSEEKTIIFSQFTSMLDLLEPFLKSEGIKFARYDGSMTPKDREASLTKIKSSLSTKVILISFKAGSTGLNLTACNNVILVDLWWNPALEDQAFDRAHRFGQTRDVFIYKLKIDKTVEDRILTLQDKKRALAAAALSGDKIKDMRLGMDELLALFRPGGKDDDEEDLY
ncbi:SNF2 family N-terminal domain-containing protein [Crepidotus variabilis]|uniref:SNF2 family N-terminal domain-containing protein n=1 Tax=Crepidotus variabilis TaxID=179855 RepID=A0A9P6JK27_9AGAR|nr:SNF2 family N-terminal domain-containing protein [Crepidotus variabilis]